MLKNKTISLLLLLFVIVVFSSYFTFQKLVVMEPIDNAFSEMEALFTTGKWGELEATYSELEAYWENYKYFISFNNGEQDYSNFTASLSRIKAAIKLKDKEQGVTEAIEAKNYFDNMMKIVPEP